MVHCQNCGNINNYGSNFCRFCGAKIVAYSGGQSAQAPFQTPQPQSFENNPPRPYSWKTDEYQVTNAKAQRAQDIPRVQPLGNYQQPPPQAMMYQQPQHATPAFGYRCPRCGSQNMPAIQRKISTAGWIVFAALLIFFFPLFWIGLLIKEDVRFCSVCNLKIG
jgi:hypothetical protein